MIILRLSEAERQSSQFQDLIQMIRSSKELNSLLQQVDREKGSSSSSSSSSLLSPSSSSANRPQQQQQPMDIDHWFIHSFIRFDCSDLL